MVDPTTTGIVGVLAGLLSIVSWFIYSRKQKTKTQELLDNIEKQKNERNEAFKNNLNELSVSTRKRRNALDIVLEKDRDTAKRRQNP